MVKNLSLLEFGYVNPPEIHTYEVINHLFDYIKLAENLGFKRFWLSEHYSNEYAWGSPETLIALLAGVTEKITVGAAGILLSYHSPLLIAQNFKLISALFAGRIDLGIAGAGVPKNIMQALINQDKYPQKQDYEKKVHELINFLTGKFAEGHKFADISVPPVGGVNPNVWVLGVSDRDNADLAVTVKSNLCISLFHPQSNLDKAIDIISYYRDNFFRIHNEQPNVSVACGFFCSQNISFIDKMRHKYITGNNDSKVYIIGDFDYCSDKLNALSRKLGIDDIVLSIPTSSLDEKEESIQSISSILNN